MNDFVNDRGSKLDKLTKGIGALAFDISHRCLSFDKWRCLLLLDDDHRCIDVVQTFF